MPLSADLSSILSLSGHPQRSTVGRRLKRGEGLTPSTPDGTASESLRVYKGMVDDINPALPIRRNMPIIPII